MDEPTSALTPVTRYPGNGSQLNRQGTISIHYHDMEEVQAIASWYYLDLDTLSPKELTATWWSRFGMRRIRLSC